MLNKNRSNDVHVVRVLCCNCRLYTETELQGEQYFIVMGKRTDNEFESADFDKYTELTLFQGYVIENELRDKRFQVFLMLKNNSV